MAKKIPKSFNALIDDFRDTNARSPSTWKGYSAAIGLMRTFCAQHYGGEDLWLEDFDTHLLTRFRIWLMKQGKRSNRGNFRADTKLDQVSVMKYINKITSVFHYGDRMEYFRYPFGSYVHRIETFIKHGADQLDRKISKADLATIESIKIGTVRLERHRLLFLLQRWTGMSWVDLRRNPDLRKLMKKSDGRDIMTYNRAKTKELAIVPVFNSTMEILNKLGFNNDPGPYNRYRDNLKKLFMFFDLDATKLGTHTGRHVFGSEMLEQGFTIEAVSRMMGHGSIEETQGVYAKVNQQKIFADMDRLKTQTT